MHELVQFNFHGQGVRSLTDEHGNPRFVASDVVAILDIGRVHDAVRGLDDDEKGADTIRTPGGEQQVTTITESGLYSLVLRSRKPEAKTFKRWVTHEVLPAIRKTGSYSTARELTFEEQTLQVITGLQSRVEEQRAELEEARPKARFADTFLSSEGDYDTRDAAQILRRDHGIVDIGQNRLRDWMQEHGWLDSKRRPYQAKVDAGYLRLKASSFQIVRTNGQRQLADPQIRVTPRGVEALVRAMKRESRQLVEGGA